MNIDESMSEEASQISNKYLKLLKSMSQQQPQNIADHLLDDGDHGQFNDYNTLYNLISDQLTSTLDSTVFFDSLYLSQNDDIARKIIRSEFDLFKQEVLGETINEKRSWIDRDKITKYIQVLVKLFSKAKISVNEDTNRAVLKSYQQN